MGITTIAKNLKKTSVEIDSFGNILSSSSLESKQQEIS